MNAYLESKKLGKTPGYCKVLNQDLQILPAPNQLCLLKENEGCYDFYWMTVDPRQINGFKTEYERLTQPSLRKNQLYYTNIISLLHKTSNQTTFKD